MTAPAPYFDGTQPCAQTDPEAFFPEKGGVGAAVDAAKRICRGCEFREACLEYALSTRIEGFPLAGIWGGTTVNERQVLSNRPCRGPLRKAECGTASGARLHRRRDEEICEPCLAAERAYNRLANHRRTDRRRAGVSA